MKKKRKMKKLKIKPKKLVSYFKELEKAQSLFWKEMRRIEKKMQKRFKDKDIEFFWVDGEIAGIGTPGCPDKMDLVHSHEIEKRK